MMQGGVEIIIKSNIWKRISPNSLPIYIVHVYSLFFLIVSSFLLQESSRLFFISRKKNYKKSRPQQEEEVGSS